MNVPKNLARLFRWLAFVVALAAAAPVLAHPAPFSYLDIDLRNGAIDGALVVHVYDAAHDLGVSPAEQLLDPKMLGPRRQALIARLEPRLTLRAGHPLKLEWTAVEPLPGRNGVKLSFRVRNERPGALSVRTDLFPYDRYHQTFVNIYDADKLRQQWVFSHGDAARTYYLGTTAGAVEVMKTFIPAGVHHILIGPDHLLFLFGLLLAGGSWKALLKIVTAFTVGHSVTLSLATLGVFTPPAAIVEPAIALTIVVVGADNLMRGEGPDLRPWAALVFGLVHGFGFASVLREVGLPREALGWSLFSFNVGVELGQAEVARADQPECGVPGAEGREGHDQFRTAPPRSAAWRSGGDPGSGSGSGSGSRPGRLVTAPGHTQEGDRRPVPSIAPSVPIGLPPSSSGRPRLGHRRSFARFSGAR